MNENKKWVTIKRYENGTYLRSKNGKACRAPLKDLPFLCNILREVKQKLTEEAIKKGEINREAWILDRLLDKLSLKSIPKDVYHRNFGRRLLLSTNVSVYQVETPEIKSLEEENEALKARLARVELENNNLRRDVAELQRGIAKVTRMVEKLVETN